MFQCTGYAAQTADASLAPFTFQRRGPGPNDVEIEAAYGRMLKSDVQDRFVIDMASLPKAA